MPRACARTRRPEPITRPDNVMSETDELRIEVRSKSDLVVVQILQGHLGARLVGAQFAFMADEALALAGAIERAAAEASADEDLEGEAQHLDMGLRVRASLGCIEIEFGDDLLGAPLSSRLSFFPERARRFVEALRPAILEAQSVKRA